jgi:hypothetical protein
MGEQLAPQPTPTKDDSAKHVKTAIEVLAVPGGHFNQIGERVACVIKSVQHHSLLWRGG